MQSLTFTCPRTGRVIDPGVNTDSRTLSSVRAVTMRLQCGYCGMQHEFAIGSGLLSQPCYWSRRKAIRLGRDRREREASVPPRVADPGSPLLVSGAIQEQAPGPLQRRGMWSKQLLRFGG